VAAERRRKKPCEDKLRRPALSSGGLRFCYRGRHCRLAASVFVTVAGIVVWRPPFLLPRPALSFGGLRFYNSYQNTQEYRCALNLGCSGIRVSYCPPSC